jgi:hypothetical protein
LTVTDVPEPFLIKLRVVELEMIPRTRPCEGELALVSSLKNKTELAMLTADMVTFCEVAENVTVPVCTLETVKAKASFPPRKITIKVAANAIKETFVMACESLEIMGASQFRISRVMEG